MLGDLREVEVDVLLGGRAVDEFAVAGDQPVEVDVADGTRATCATMSGSIA